MAEIFDFTKYKTEQEIEMYLTESELGEDELMCYGCFECQNPTFMMTIEKEIICADCGIAWGAAE